MCVLTFANEETSSAFKRSDGALQAREDGEEEKEAHPAPIAASSLLPSCFPLLPESGEAESLQGFSAQIKDPPTWEAMAASAPGMGGKEPGDGAAQQGTLQGTHLLLLAIPPLQPFTRPRRLAVMHPNISSSPLGLQETAVRDQCKPILSTGKTKWGPSAAELPHVQRKRHGFHSPSAYPVPGTVLGSGGIRNALHSQTVHRNREDVKHVNAITWGRPRPGKHRSLPGESTLRSHHPAGADLS